MSGSTKAVFVDVYSLYKEHAVKLTGKMYTQDVNDIYVIWREEWCGDIKVKTNLGMN